MWAEVEPCRFPFDRRTQAAANFIAAFFSCFASVERVDALSRIAPEEFWPEPGTGVAHEVPGHPVSESALVAAARAPARSVKRKAAYPYTGWDPECWMQSLQRHGWPRSGAIEFNQVTARYGLLQPPALRKVSAQLRECCSVGIVGR